MQVVTSNTKGYSELQNRGVKPQTVLKLYADIRQAWFKFKRGAKAKRKQTRVEYERDLVSFYNDNIAGKTWFQNYREFRSFFNQYPPTKTVTDSTSAQKRQREGFDFDRRVAALLKNEFLDVYTTAGSRSEFDVVAIPKSSTRKVVFAQCKRNRRLELKDVKPLVKFLAKAPKWAEVRLYYHEQESITYSVLTSENDVRWFSTSSQTKRDELGLKQPKKHNIVEASELSLGELEVQAADSSGVAVNVATLLVKLAWTGSKSKFQDFHLELIKLWKEIVGCRYNLAKNATVDAKFRKLCAKYRDNLGIKNYEVFKVFRLKQFEPKVEITSKKLATQAVFARESTGRTELAAYKAMKSGALFLCRTDKDASEIMHVIRVRGEVLEFAFCRASGLLSKLEHDALTKYFKALPKYVVGRFYYYQNGKKCVYKDLGKNLSWFQTQRGVDLSATAI